MFRKVKTSILIDDPQNNNTINIKVIDTDFLIERVVKIFPNRGVAGVAEELESIIEAYKSKVNPAYDIYQGFMFYNKLYGYDLLYMIGIYQKYFQKVCPFKHELIDIDDKYLVNTAFV